MADHDELDALLLKWGIPANTNASAEFRAFMERSAAGQGMPVAWIDKASLAELQANRSTYAHVVHKCRSVDGDTPLYTHPSEAIPENLVNVNDEIWDDIEKALAAGIEGHCAPALDELDMDLLWSLVGMHRARALIGKREGGNGN